MDLPLVYDALMKRCHTDNPPTASELQDLARNLEDQEAHAGEMGARCRNLAAHAERAEYPARYIIELEDRVSKLEHLLRTYITAHADLHASQAEDRD